MMNPNGTYESEVNRKIDRVLASGQASGDPVLDDLVSTTPKANPDFQQRLENTLIEKMQAKQRTVMHTTIPVKQPRRFTIPATLAAAMLAVLMGAALFINRAPNHPTAAAIFMPERTAEQVVQAGTPSLVPMESMEPFALTATAVMANADQEIDSFALAATALIGTSTQETLDLTTSPTPPAPSTVALDTETRQSVVVARVDIPANTLITEAMVGLAYFPTDAVPQGSFKTIETVTGRSLEQAVPRGYPIVITDGLLFPIVTTTPTPTLTATPLMQRVITPTPTPVLSSEVTYVMLPLTIANSSFNELNAKFSKTLTPGRRIDVIVHLLFVDVVDEANGITTPQDMLAVGVRDAEIVAVDEANAVIVAVPVQDATLLNYYVEAQIPMLYAFSPPLQMSSHVPTSIPDVSEGVIMHTVQPGETLLSILVQYGLSLNDDDLARITALNPDLMGNGELQTGAVLLLPMPNADATTAVLCQMLVVNTEGAVVRELPTVQSNRAGIVPPDTALNVIHQALSPDDQSVWYFVQPNDSNERIAGWIRGDNVRPQTGSVCPSLVAAVPPTIQFDTGAVYFGTIPDVTFVITVTPQP